MKKSRTELPVGRCIGDRWENTAPSPSTVLDDVPDELLELVFLRLPSSPYLIRAACTCKRWRRVVADGGFLRRFRALHPRPVVTGHYRVDERRHGSVPPGCNPVFFVSPSADTTLDLRPQRFSLDFLPPCDGGFWDLADSRGGIILLHDYDRSLGEVWPQLGHLVVCDPMTRRCSRVIPPPTFHDHQHQFLGAFLLDSDAEEAGSRISLTNFRIIVAFYDNGIAYSHVLSSRNGNGGGWTMATSKSKAENWLMGFMLFVGLVAESVYWTTVRGGSLVLHKDTAELKFCSSQFPDQLHFLRSRLGIVHCHDGSVRIASLGRPTHLKVFIQAQGSDEWVQEKSVPLHQLTRKVKLDNQLPTRIVSVPEGCITLVTKEGAGLISVDLATMKFKRVTHNENRYHGPAHMYQLPWPLTIRACLS